MSTYSQPGAVLPIKLPGTTAKGALVAIGDSYAVALAGGAENDIVNGALEGVFPLPKKDGVTIVQGEQLYLDTGELTNVANTAPVGIAAEDGASAAVIIHCKINFHSAKDILAAACC
jgi:predicted RecA/RadA family phage recombinase